MKVILGVIATPFAFVAGAAMPGLGGSFLSGACGVVVLWIGVFVWMSSEEPKPGKGGR